MDEATTPKAGAGKSGPAAKPQENTLRLNLKALRGDGEWVVSFDEAVVSLCDPEGRQVLMVPRETIAQYVQFRHDLLRGWTISFAVLGGMRPHEFRCSDDDLAAVLTCMPRKPSSEVVKEVRLHAIALALFGVLYFMLPDPFVWWWGVALLGLGVTGLAYPNRRIYLPNGLLMFVVGVAQLFTGQSAAPGPAGRIDTLGILSSIAGIVFVCWGVQQFFMLGPNAQIRVARVRQDRIALAVPGRPSLLIRRMAHAILAGAALFWAYSLALFALIWIGAPLASTPTSVTGIDLAMLDVVACPFLGALALVAGIVLLTRGRSAYAEAKVISQFLVVVLLVALWGAVFSFDPANLAGLFGGLLANGLLAFVKPYVWTSLLIAVLVFNRLFSRAVDRELSEGHA
jgi:hypothetical protein